jgi:hypothetical protein
LVAEIARAIRAVLHGAALDFTAMKLLLHLAVILLLAQAQKPVLPWWEFHFNAWSLKHPSPNSGCDPEQYAEIAVGPAAALSCDGRLVKKI